MAASGTKLTENQRFPTDVQRLILTYLAEDILTDTATFQANGDVFKGATQHDQPYDKLNLQILLRSIVTCDYDRAIVIIKSNPELLFQSSTVEFKDFAGNQYSNYSPVSLARYMHDTKMLKIMESYIGNIPNGKTHFEEIHMAANKFEKEQKVYDFEQIAAVIATNDKENIDSSIKQFRAAFGPTHIKGQLSFNIENLRAAYNTYKKHYGEWNMAQRSLFWSQVVGYMQRMLPMSFVIGLYYAFPYSNSADVGCNIFKLFFSAPIKNKLVFWLGDVVEAFYSTNFEESKGLGFDFGVSSVARRTVHETSVTTISNFETFCKQNQSELTLLAESSESSANALKFWLNIY